MNDPFEHGDRPLVPFAQTRWSLISGSRDPERAEKALSDLCEIYWYPVYAFIRRQGKSHDETEDLVQGLFQSLLERETFQKADRNRGRLRSYLCVAAKRHLISVSRYQQRLKRGGNMRFVPYDEEAADLHYNQTCCENVSPEIEFDRSWATAVIKSTFKELERYYEAKGKLKLMKAMIPFLKSDLSEGQQGPVAESRTFTDRVAQAGEDDGGPGSRTVCSPQSVLSAEQQRVS